MIIHLNIIGVTLILLGLIHIIFPSYFKWKTELAGLSLVNRQMMYIHTFFIAFAIVLMGALCLWASNEIVSTALGKKISLGMGIFWTTRLLFQFVGYSKKLWFGKLFESVVHYAFVFYWGYLSGVFFTIYWS